MKCLRFRLFSSTRSVLSRPLLVWTLVWGKMERKKSSLLLQTVPLDKSKNAVFKNPCSLMYSFVLLNIGFDFNLNILYLYLTFRPLFQSVVCVTLCRWQVSGRSLCVFVWLSARLLWEQEQQTCSFPLCPSVPNGGTVCYRLRMAWII